MQDHEKIVETNRKLSELITINQSFLVSRTGWGAEPICTEAILNNKKDSIKPIIFSILEYNAGIYNQTNDNLKIWAFLYADAIKKSDICFIWDSETVQQGIKVSQNALTKNVKTMSADTLDPINAINIGIKPWTLSLYGKRVLIVSPFIDSIKSQIDKKYKLFGDDTPLFHEDQEYVYYKTFSTLGGNFLHSNWRETFNKMITDIDKLDFDIALVSCGGYGLPICNFIKTKMQKSAIYLGGVLALLFGVTCKRYGNNFNPGLITPSENETIQLKSFKDLYDSDCPNEVEDGCYW